MSLVILVLTFLPDSLLQRGSMFVFSMQQFRILIDFDTTYGSIKLDNLLGIKRKNQKHSNFPN